MGISRRPKKFDKKQKKQKKKARKEARKERSTPADRSGRQGFILTVVDGPNVGKEFFFEDSATVGRVESNDIIMVEPGISRTHCRVYDDQGIYLVEDAGSANGTRLNGEVVQEPEVLRDGDYITLSASTIQFSVLDAARGDITAPTNLSELEASHVDATRTNIDTEAAAGLKGFIRSKRGKLFLGIGLVIVTGLVVFLTRRNTDQIIQVDQSKTPLVYSEDDSFFNAVFGYGKYDRSHLYSVKVGFEYLGGRATLQYGAWGIDKVDEVEVQLNGKKVSTVPLTMNRWVYGLKVVLPRELLNKKKANEVTFRNLRNPPHKDTWEICYLQVIQEAIPKPDPKEARFQFELAKKAWIDKDIEPRNMYTAFERFKRCRDLLEGLAERPELYKDALAYIARIDKALTRKFSEGLFSARRVEKLDGDRDKAKAVLIQTRRYFHKDDFRFREIQRYIDSIAGY